MIIIKKKESFNQIIYEINLKLFWFLILVIILIFFIAILIENLLFFFSAILFFFIFFSELINLKIQKKKTIKNNKDYFIEGSIFSLKSLRFFFFK